MLTILSKEYLVSFYISSLVRLSVAPHHPRNGKNKTYKKNSKWKWNIENICKGISGCMCPDRCSVFTVSQAIRQNRFGGYEESTSRLADQQTRADENWNTTCDQNSFWSNQKIRTFGQKERPTAVPLSRAFRWVWFRVGFFTSFTFLYLFVCIFSFAFSILFSILI